MPCNLICERFLKQIRKRYNKTYWRTYNRRVVGSYQTVINNFKYIRCKKCEILLAEQVYGLKCPCCDSRLYSKLL